MKPCPKAHHWMLEATVDGITPAKCKRCPARTKFIDPDLVRQQSWMNHSEGLKQQKDDPMRFGSRPFTGTKRQTTQVFD